MNVLQQLLRHAINEKSKRALPKNQKHHKKERGKKYHHKTTLIEEMKQIKYNYLIYCKFMNGDPIELVCDKFNIEPQMAIDAVNDIETRIERIEV